MDYLDLNKDNIIAYVKQRTTFFAPDAALQVYAFGDSAEDGDGFINYLYRVWEEGGMSVIVKQAKTRQRAYGENAIVPFVVERNALEAEHMRIKYAITPEYIPEVYHIDPENHSFICEDAGDLKILRFELMKGVVYRNVGTRIGEFIAKSNFYTSEVYLDPITHQELASKFTNARQRVCFETNLFLYEEKAIIDPDAPDPDPIRVKMGAVPWKSKAFRTEMLKLRHVHMKKPECLVHGDLHTSNILLDDTHMKIIDMEYSYMGPLSGDMGYLIGSVLYEYIRWFYLPAYPKAFCAEMRAYVLELMKTIVESYLKTYRDCWQKDARETYQGFDDYCDYICETWFHEVMGFAGCQLISRVANIVPLPDLDTIPDVKDYYNACRISIAMGYYLIMHRNDIADMDDFIKRFVGIVDEMRQKMNYSK